MSNCAWSETYPLGRCRYLRFEGSDHRPLLTYFNADKTKRRGLFRFNRALTEQEEVTEVVEKAWNSSPLDSVIGKLNNCRRNIIQWAKEKQIQSNKGIKQNQDALEIALSSPNPDTQRIEKLNTELRQAYLAEEQFWQQRSRIQWLKKGDRNTGFFHAATRTRRTINSISVIEDVQGGAVYEEEQIARVISDYFTQIFTSNGNESFSQIQGLLAKKLLIKGLSWAHLPELFGIMFDIYHYVSLFDVISISFISRNFNSEADLVAKSALAGSVMSSVMNSALGE
ncbi:BnaC01g31370D [Brassica napus]|uniref:BnaC01g31370D protein n=1 Tax=Brassica napus TaxID=3708 RepID=A0A078HTZ5_BRANA|nr:BnaC01g31370D [Brassica napus]